MSATATDSGEVPDCTKLTFVKFVWRRFGLHCGGKKSNVYGHVELG